MAGERIPSIAPRPANAAAPTAITFRSVADDSRYLAAVLWHRQADANGTHPKPVRSGRG